MAIEPGFFAPKNIGILTSRQNRSGSWIVSDSVVVIVSQESGLGAGQWLSSMPKSDQLGDFMEESQW